MKKILLPFKKDRQKQWNSIFYQISEIANLNLSSVLEIGGGTNLNRHIFKYLDKNIDYKVCDVNAEYKPDYLCDFQNLELNNQFDMVCAFQILEHNSLENLENMLKKMRSLSKKFVLFSVPFNGQVLSVNINFRLFGRAFYFSKTFVSKTITTKNTDTKKIEQRVKKNPKKKYDPHYWEVGRKEMSKLKFDSLLKKLNFKIVKEYYNEIFPYHLFYLLKKN
jgi:hypothetical protein